MSWFKRKTQKEKIQELQDEVDKLNIQWKNVINSYCKIGNYIFILKGFKHDEKQVCVRFIDKDTPKDYINYLPLWVFKAKYDIYDFNVARYQFVKFKDELNKIGLELKLLDK